LIPSLPSKAMRIEVLFEAHTHLSSSPLPLPEIPEFFMFQDLAHLSPSVSVSLCVSVFQKHHP
jgi:hypothetical protein